MELCEATLEQKQKYLQRLPSSLLFDGTIWPEAIITAESILAVKDMTFGHDDIVIAAFPKSGMTWVTEVVSAIVNEGETDALRSIRMEERVTWLELNRKAWPADQTLVSSSTKKIWFTHLPLRHLPSSITEGKCKLLYVVRNPKDQAVSFFHFHKIAIYLGLQTDLTWNEFFPLFCSGFLCFGNWFDHVLEFWKLTRDNPNTKFIFYENMKINLMEEVKSIEEFIGVPLSVEKRAKVVEHCLFDSMKDNNMTNRSQNRRYNQKHGKFMRKGIVGDWKNYFTITQNEAFDELFKKKMEGSGLDFKFA